MKKVLIVLLFIFILAGCQKNPNDDNNKIDKPNPGESIDDPNKKDDNLKPGDDDPNKKDDNLNPGNNDSDIKDDDKTYGDDLNNSNIYDGYFEDDLSNFQVKYESGTDNIYKYENNVLTFSTITEDTVYSITGQLKGNIIIDVGDDYKFELEMKGFSLVCDTTNPIVILSGDKVTLSAKKETENYIYDNRETIDSTDDNLHSAAIYSKVDLNISGKGSLSVVSSNNNGIHTKDDLKVKNLTLNVKCVDNALKGNDSITIESGTLTLIATKGDGMKTKNSDISSKGNQKGTISIQGGEHTIYAACDGIDAAYNVVIDSENTIVNIYTDKYSNYSEEVTDVKEETYYIRNNSQNYKYSIKYYNSDDDYLWVSPSFSTSVNNMREKYYYYSFVKNSNYNKLQVYIYSSEMSQNQDQDYLYASEFLTINNNYDTIAISNSKNQYRLSWTNFSTTSNPGGFGGMGGFGGPGGMDEGNTDKGDYSTKGIKADNEIIINNGTITIKSYDDAIHANNDNELENNETPVGNITINGGTLSLYSNDDGIHADGEVIVNGGTITILYSYEGLEGNKVTINNGNVSIKSKDDGINATTTSGEGIVINDGYVYVYATGDGLDSNSQTSYSGIVFNGGNVVIISFSNGNSAIDTERGYKYTGGNVVAIMPTGGMTSESTNCQNFKTIATSKNVTIKSSNYLSITENNEVIVQINVNNNTNVKVIYLGSNSVNISTVQTIDNELDINNVYWNK